MTDTMGDRIPDPQRGISVSTAREAAQEAGSQKIGMSVDLIDEFRDYCKKFIESANLPSHQRMMALPKCDEMIFWIRAGYGKG